MPNVESPMGGFKELKTKSGATIRLETKNALTVVSATEVSFRTDWGVQVRIPLPLPEVVVIEGPTER